jgi:uncharacterized protein (TIGR00369 family)
MEPTMSAADLDENFHSLMPFSKLLGITVVKYEATEVCARLAWDAGLCTSGGVLHGGALMTLADSTGAACAFLNLPAGSAGTTTVESKTNFLRAVRNGYVESRSRPLHAGRAVIVIETDLCDQRGKLVARVTQSQLVLGG